MPLYDYQCSKCKNVMEVRHGFNDRYAEPCSACGADLKRVFNPAPILFKGSGFYVTDSRKKEKDAGSTPSTPGTAAGATGATAPAAGTATATGNPVPAAAPSPSKESAA